MKRTPGLARPSGFNAGRAYQRIPGWFSDCEAELLYLLTLMAAGRVLEIGHFLGRSTAAMCDALRDSGRPVEFNSYDLGYTDEAAVRDHYRRLYAEPGFELPATFRELVFAAGRTTTDLAREHLTAAGLAGHVNLIAGDFAELDRTRYDLIFCDVAHDPREIAHNLPRVAAVSADVCTWAVHDSTDANIAAVLAHPGVTPITRVDSLGVYQFRR